MNKIALIGKKIGMTREFLKTGQSVPVTVLKMEKGRVVQIISDEKTTCTSKVLRLSPSKEVRPGTLSIRLVLCGHVSRR